MLGWAPGGGGRGSTRSGSHGGSVGGGGGGGGGGGEGLNPLGDDAPKLSGQAPQTSGSPKGEPEKLSGGGGGESGDHGDGREVGTGGEGKEAGDAGKCWDNNGQRFQPFFIECLGGNRSSFVEVNVCENIMGYGGGGVRIL